MAELAPDVLCAPEADWGVRPALTTALDDLTVATAAEPSTTSPIAGSCAPAPRTRATAPPAPTD